MAMRTKVQAPKYCPPAEGGAEDPGSVAMDESMIPARRPG